MYENETNSPYPGSAGLAGMITSQQVREGTQSGSIYRSKQAGNFATSVPERYPQVAGALDTLQKELSVQGDRLATLASRLGPIMSIEPPSGEIGNKMNEPTAPIAATLYRIGLQLGNQTALVDSLLRRLEI